MKVLFYLPVVTPWWFQTIIVPMLRTLQNDGAAVELHVMVAPLWRNTGIEAEHLGAAADLTSVHWHIIDEGEPEQFRLNGAQVPGLLDLVAEIAPDVTLARSADLAIVRNFPGAVRFIMEAGAAPFASDLRWVILEERPIAHSALPAKAISLADDCARLLQPAWSRAERNGPAPARSALRRQLGLADDRKVLAVPLQYEHEENFFLSLAAFPSGIATIEALLAATGDDVALAITDHPLNRVHTDREATKAYLAQRASRVFDCTGQFDTRSLALAADAMVVDLSKSWSLAAFHGQPIVDIARRPMASWLRAVRGLDALPAALAAGPLDRADPADARRWFGWHYGARIIDPDHLTPDRLERAIRLEPSAADITRNVAMVLDYQIPKVDPTNEEAAA